VLDCRFSELLDDWAEALGWLPDADDYEEVVAALIARDNIDSALRAGEPMTDAEREQLRELDGRFLRMRATLATAFPEALDPEYRRATEHEWWWWPDRMPEAEAVPGHSRS
jgi:hypothetical protein